MKDYAKCQHQSAWFRHPTLGDVSFDTFEKLGETVHRSEPPLEWGVNASLFKDPKSGNWYVYAGLYPFGYRIGPEFAPSTFWIYRSSDRGASWECLGPGMGDFCLAVEGYEVPVRNHPDATLTYDAESDRYWLAYDFGSDFDPWESAHQNIDPKHDSGAGLAFADSPEGPFHPLKTPFFSNVQQRGKLGRFSRGYASTVLKRERDWIAFVLCDSDQHFSWGLACMTAARPEGPWSEPQMLLSVDREGYYPAPVEFYPCFVQDGRVYAPATSVARNRNYQAVFSAPLEESHRADVWTLDFDGGFWHSRRLADETYGIWGQTIHGFVEDGQFYCVYPSKDARNFGTMSIASRRWDRPVSDGFTFSGHAGRSVSPLLAACEDFSLSATCAITGTIEFAFGYRGILGPNVASAEAVPHESCFCDYLALALEENGTASVVRHKAGQREVLSSRAGAFRDASDIRLALSCNSGWLSVAIDGLPVWTGAVPVPHAAPLALIAQEFSMLRCETFELDGARFPYELRFNAFDALLGAGQCMSDWQGDSGLAFAGPAGFVGQGNVRGKWNFIGSSAAIFAPKSPELGEMDVYVDGYYSATVCLRAEQATASAPIYRVEGLTQGRHGLSVRPRRGKIALDLLAVWGKQDD